MYKRQGDIVGASNQLSIETEAELQIPNSDFETWSEKFVWKGTGKPGSIDIYTFYPYEAVSYTHLREARRPMNLVRRTRFDSANRRSC